MRSYSTQYVHGGATFMSEIIADNDTDAERLLKLRGIGEVIVGFPYLNAPEFANYGKYDLLRELAFTGWVASKSMPSEPMISCVNTLIDRVNEVRATLGMPRIRKVR